MFAAIATIKLRSLVIMMLKNTDENSTGQLTRYTDL